MWFEYAYGIVRCRTLDNDRTSRGSRGTFVVHVQARQNATWQGNVVWAEKNITRSFRSALELLKMIDHSLDESEITAE